jgi:ubiquinone biosynthesis protein COQ9
MKLPENYAYIFFPKGVEELKAYFYASIDGEFIENFNYNNVLGVKNFVSAALGAYFELLLPYKEALLIAPKSLKTSLSQSLKVANLIWHKAQDKSLDINYYSKRVILARIYQVVYEEFLQEKSGMLMQDFIEQQIAKATKLAKVKHNIQAKIKRVPFLRLLIKN